MPRRAKIVLVSIVLVVGFVVALQFRKPATTKTSAPRNESVSQAVSPKQQIAEPVNGAPPLDLSASGGQPSSGAPDPGNRFPPATQESGARSQTEGAAVGTSTLTASQIAAAPSSAEGNEFHTAAGSATKPPENALPDLPARFSENRFNSSSTSDFHSESQDASPAQSHKIVDGDSLPLLAERYLGSASRAEEIFACNRDVLSDPELLPIGARLRIPSGQSRPQSVAVDAPSAATSSTATPAPAPAAPQIAVAQPATAGTSPLLDIGSAGLSPLPPLDAQAQAGAQAPGKIYVVQNGDTLASIAQKVYGDSTRAETLLQANREQLRSEQDLRAGMLLATP